MCSKAVVLSILLYDTETWIIKAPDVRPFITIVSALFWVWLDTSSGRSVLQLRIV